MSPLLLPLTPRFIALTLAILSTLGFAVALAWGAKLQIHLGAIRRFVLGKPRIAIDA